MTATTTQTAITPSRFWLKLVAIVFPFALAFAILSGVTIWSGEAMPLAWVVNQQIVTGDTLYRPRYGNRDQQFKALSVAMRHPQVLAIGSSRILQFRAGFFNKQPETFYNAGAPAWTLTEVERLLYTLPADALPRVLLLALDPPWFNDAYEEDVLPADQSDGQHLIEVNMSLLNELANGVSLERNGFAIGDYFQRRVAGRNTPALGLRAMRDGHGFRSDGSELYGDFLVAGWLYQPNTRAAHRDWMREGRDMYVFGETISADALTRLDALLGWTRARGIAVIGFLPSYMPSLWEEMVARGNHRYLTVLPQALAPIFAAHDYPILDFSDGEAIPTTDEEFFDGWHGSELSNLRLYLHILTQYPDVLSPYSDADSLRALADSSGNTWEVFGG